MGREAREELVGEAERKEPKEPQGKREGKKSPEEGRQRCRREIAQAWIEGENQRETAVPVKAEEMKQSLRPGRVKTRTGERDGSKAEA